MVDLVLSIDVKVGIENICTFLAFELYKVGILPWSNWGESWAPIPAKVGLFFADEPAVRELKCSLNSGGPF
jgi:hypothetical protein